MPQIAIEAKLADFTAWRRDADRKISRLEGEIADLRTNLAVALAAQAANTGVAGATKVDRSRDETAPILPEFKALAENPAVWSTVAAGLAPAAAITAPVLHAAGSALGADSSPTPAVAPAPGKVPSPSSPSVVVAPDSAPRVVAIASTARLPHVQYDLQMRPGESIDLPGALDGERRKRMVGWLFLALVVVAMAALVISSLASQR